MTLSSEKSAHKSQQSQAQQSQAQQSQPQQALIAPSILAADAAALGSAAAAVEKAGADWIHLDVMDGHFVPNLTFGPPVIAALRRHSSLPFDVHLMIERPEASIDAYIAAGADAITVHAETCPHLHRTLQGLQQAGVKSGVSINPSTPIESILHVLDVTDLVLVMTVNPGFGGQKFIPAAAAKIAPLRQEIEKQNLKTMISVDGGITPAQAHTVKALGAEILVAGSAIFGAEDYTAAIQALKEA